MTRNKFFLTHMTAVGMAAFLAQPLAAMTCAEFSELDEDAQMQAAVDMDKHARDAVREDTPLAEGSEGADDTVVVETDDASDSAAPRDETRAEDRGAEMIEVIRRGCDADPEAMVDDLVKDMAHE
ncbi:hypothetical protein AAFO92_12465 [Roseovarius sp. CAU 1744]|uniref:hypothetical protein n=1 Tax=Roseovarius sp. CAU 1744 TaxID=3140368 RepID=UPI00325B86C9